MKCISCLYRLPNLDYWYCQHWTDIDKKIVEIFNPKNAGCDSGESVDNAEFGKILATMGAKAGGKNVELQLRPC